jgi:hypothetical protein
MIASVRSALPFGELRVFEPKMWRRRGLGTRRGVTSGDRFTEIGQKTQVGSSRIDTVS